MIPLHVDGQTLRPLARLMYVLSDPPSGKVYILNLTLNPGLGAAETRIPHNREDRQ
jgi:hypothetical protein